VSVHLTMRTAPEVLLDLEAIQPLAFAELDETGIARVTLRHGREQVALGDFFDVRGARSADVVIGGDFSKAIGLGSGMSGGTLRVEGDAPDLTGAGMSGGLIEVRGDAGSRLGGARGGAPRGMTGGTILVQGSAGDDAGERMRRGTIAVAGRVGARAASQMIAGTVLVVGEVGPAAASGMRRGTLVAGGAVEPLPGFRLACRYRPTVVALLVRELAALGFGAAARLISGEFDRYTGDCAELGRGELLHWRAP
jgi:formylmethanofuran dehydrogenase subunit C